MATVSSMKHQNCMGVIALFLVLVLTALPSAGQAPPDAALEAVPDDVVDEITVVAPRSLRILERQIERADEAMYRMFNKMNNDSLYNVHCGLEKRYASNIRRRVCKPGFERDIMAEVREDEIRMGRQGESIVSGDYRIPQAELREHREELKRRMQKFAAENPELAQAIYKRANLQRAYEKERKRRLSSKDE